MYNEIAVWFLVLSLFFPRITLLIAYCNGVVPLNNIPFWGDFFMTLFIPRVLILIYIITNMGFGMWAIIHLIALVISYGCSVKVRSKAKRS